MQLILCDSFVMSSCVICFHDIISCNLSVCLVCMSFAHFSCSQIFGTLMLPFPLLLLDPHKFSCISLIVACTFECNLILTGCLYWGLSPTTNPSPTLSGSVNSTQPKDIDCSSKCLLQRFNTQGCQIDWTCSGVLNI